MVAAIGLALAVDSSWRQGYLYAATMLTMILIALDEYASLAQRLGIRVDRAFLIFGGGALFIVQWIGWINPAWGPGMPAITLLCLMTMGLLSLRVADGQIQDALQATGATALGWLYLPVMLGFLSGVRVRWGMAGLILVLLVCKSSSSGAYFVGSFFGKRRLIPSISPNKTIAGVVGALATGMAVSCLLSFLPWKILPPLVALLYGALVSLAAIVGDLGESLLKRQASLKDSGAFLPGIGGMMDMLDDVLLVAPISFLFFRVCEILNVIG